MNPVIKTSKLQKIYDMGKIKVTALKSIDIEIFPGEFVAIMGPSGSGKSTLMHILGCLDTPNTGKYYIDEHEVSAMHKNQLAKIRNNKIGFVFQKHNLFPHLTLKENITLVLEKTRHYSKAEAQEKATFYLNLLHLQNQANKLPKHVSGGEAQRASLARALSIDPDFIFLDEPTSSLDPILTDEVLKAVEELKGLGKEFLFITHVMSFVKDFADYVIYMDQGVIKEHGEPSILTNPKTQSLKEFMEKVR